MALHYTANSPIEQAIIDAGYNQGFGEGGAQTFRADPAHEALVQQMLALRSNNLLPLGDIGSLQYSGVPSTTNLPTNPVANLSPTQRQEMINTFGDQVLGYDPVTSAIVGNDKIRNAQGQILDRGSLYGAQSSAATGPSAAAATVATPAATTPAPSSTPASALRYTANSPIEQAIINAGYNQGFGAGGAQTWRSDPTHESLIQQNLGAYNSALSGAQNYVTSKGLNYGEFQPDIESAIMNAFKGVAPGSSNPGSYFDPNIASTALDTVQGNRRTKYLNDVNSLFGASDSGATAFADNADDDVLNSILGDQFGTASKSLDNSRSRGILDDTGYNEALSRLTNQKTAGLSKLQSLGGTVLATDRQKLDDIANSGRTAASNYTLGQTFDPSSYQTRFNTTKDALTGSLEGDIRNVIGDSSLFDVNSATQFGGQAQGAQNTRALTPFDAISGDDRKTTSRTNQRGLGTQGVF